MLSFIRKANLQQKQGIIKRKYPRVNIILHPDMPISSMSKMVELAGIVDKVNALEPQISKLSDAQLKEKTGVFKEHVLKKSQGLDAHVITVSSPSTPVEGDESYP